MIKAVMFVAISFSGVSESNYTIPGYESMEACKQSQQSVARQILTESFDDSTGKPLPQDPRRREVTTKCIEL